ncbi:MAG: two-component regulator propeller domain-containing protein [Bacteroidota bacterium]
MMSRLVLLLTCLGLRALFGQNLPAHYRIFDHQDGLPGNQITDLLSDQAGYLWIGTRSGLSRFDGRNFENFPRPEIKGEDMAGSHIRHLYQDRSGLIWIDYLAHAVSVYSPQQDRFAHFTQEEASAEGMEMSCWHEDQAGKFWLGTKSGLWAFDRHTFSFHKVRLDNRTRPHISALAEDPMGRLWIASTEEQSNGSKQNQLFVLDPCDSVARQIQGVSRKLGFGVVSSILFWGKQDVLIGSFNRGLFRARWNLNGLQSELLPVSGMKTVLRRPEDLSIHGLGQYDQDRIWVQANSDVLLYGVEDHQWQKLPMQNLPAVPDQADLVSIHSPFQKPRYIHWANIPGVFLPQDQTISEIRRQQLVKLPFVVNQMLEDQTGNLWIGTDFQGLVFLPHQADNFQVIRYDESGSRAQNKFFGMAEDTVGKVWISSADGLHVLQADGQRLKRIDLDDEGEQRLNQEKIFNLHFSAQEPEQLWLGYFQTQISRLHTHTLHNHPYRFHPKDTTSFTGWSIRALLEDRGGNLWIGYTTGLSYFDREDGVFHELHEQPEGKGIPGSQAVWCLLESQNGDIWIGTNHSGLYRYRPTDQSWTSFHMDDQDPRSLPDNSIRSLAEDKEGNLWVGTQNGGLVYFEQKHNAFHQVTVNQEMPGSGILGILLRHDRELWFSTNKGLYRLRLDGNFPAEMTGRLRQFLVEDGLSASEFNINSFLKTRDGHFLFGSENGLTRFHPAQIEEAATMGPPAIASILLDGEAVGPGLVSLSEEEANLQLAFRVPFSVQTSDLEFAYQMEGYDQDWRPTDQWEAVYQHLPVGHYQFRLRSRLADGPWIEMAHAKAIVVQRNWGFAMNWMIGLGFLFLLAGMWRKWKNKQAEIVQSVPEPAMSKVPSPVHPKLSPFVLKMHHVIEARLSDDQFSVQELAQAMGVSRTQLYRKTSELIDSSVHKLIQQKRLEKGRRLLIEQNMQVAEVAYAVGFKSAAHFSRAFKSTFDVSPSEFLTLSTHSS